MQEEKKNEYGYKPKNNCKSKKELRDWIRIQNNERIEVET